MSTLHPDPRTTVPDPEGTSVGGARGGTVTVGYDESPESVAALHWAGGWADSHAARLMVVSAVSPLLAVAPGAGRPGPGPDELRQAVQRAARRGAESVARRFTGLEVRSIGTVGDPAAELVALSGASDLVVVGRRRNAEHPAASLGSVSFALGAHARCPVVVVQGAGTVEAGPGRPVVVGVDTSRPSERAVTFAADAARAARAELVVVSAWSRPDVGPWIADLWGGSGAASEVAADERDRARVSVESALDHVAQSHPDLRVTSRTAEGSPDEVLLEEARDAGLLVVGARGRGGFVGLMLGSVTRSVLRQADLPVAVVRSGGG